jgi:TPR repeat protein
LPLLMYGGFMGGKHAVSKCGKTLIFLLGMLPTALFCSIQPSLPDASTDSNEFSRELARAQRGDAEAENFVGLCYQKGWGVDRDLKEGELYYAKAADKGDAQAEADLGMCFLNGKGVGEDFERALKLFRASARQGNGDGECGVGICYVSGKGVDLDAERAVSWFRKAAGQGDAMGEFWLGNCYLKGLGVEIYRGPVGEDSSRPSGQGSVTGRNLGNGGMELYLRASVPFGDPPGGKRDYAKAMAFFRKAAAQGYTGAEDRIGYLYYWGAGVVQDHGEAAKWYKKAADEDDPVGEYLLGLLYLNGQGVPKNRGSGMEYLRRSAEQGFIGAQNRLKTEMERARIAGGNHGAGLAADYSNHANPKNKHDPDEFRFRRKDGSMVEGDLEGFAGGSVELLTDQGHVIFLAADVETILDSRGKKVSLASLRRKFPDAQTSQ